MPAALYDLTMRFAERLRPTLGLDWRVVRYESLVADLMRETREICEFIGLEAAAGLGDFAARVQAREHATPSTAQLARGLDRSGIGYWRHYARELEPVLPVLEPWAQRLRYPP